MTEIRADPDAPSVRWVLGSSIVPQALTFLAIGYVLVFVPSLRVAAGAWVVLLVGLIAFGVLRLRAMARGRREHTSLVLDGLELRYTDWRGQQVVCSRAAVRRAVLLFVTSRKRTSNLVVFQAASGAALMTFPYGLFPADAVDKLLSDLGVDPLNKTFINSKAELDAAAPGLVLPGLYVTGTTTLFDRNPASRRVVLGTLVVIVIFFVVFVVLATRG